MCISYRKCVCISYRESMCIFYVYVAFRGTSTVREYVSMCISCMYALRGRLARNKHGMHALYVCPMCMPYVAACQADTAARTECMPYMYSLYLCLIFMPYDCLQRNTHGKRVYVYILCMPDICGLHICLVHMPCLYASCVCFPRSKHGERVYVCLVGMPHTYGLHVCFI